MRIEVYWKDDLLYKADASHDFNIPVAPYTDLQRKTFAFDHRVETMERLAQFFIMEVQRKLDLMHIKDAQIFLIFESRMNTWSSLRTKKVMNQRDRKKSGKKPDIP